MDDAFTSTLNKLQRAIVIRQEILDCLAGYNSAQPFETYLKPSSEHEHWRPTTSPPSELSVLLGEFLYQVRSALDHGFFALVAAKKGRVQPDGDWQRQTQFPLIGKKPEGSGDAVSRQQFPSPARDWISDEAFEFIERIQPYHRGKEPNDTLKALAVLSNIDKHRRFALTTLGVEIKDVNVSAQGTITTLSWTFDKDKELVPLSSPPEMAYVPTNLKREITPVLAFDEPDLGQPQSARVSDTVLEIWHAGWWVGRWLAKLGSDSNG
jgi:hypothetical protein